jgi:heme A synthase
MWQLLKQPAVRAARAVDRVALPFCFALGGLTFALIVLGGIVHNTGSSLACPDWPLCNGTAFPRMVGAVLIEHGHRLTALAVVVGTILLLVGLATHPQKTDRDRGNVKVAVVALGLVIVQALLGALTVKLRLPPLVSTGHLATSMLYFSTVLYLAFRLRRGVLPALSPGVQTLTAIAAVLIYIQMIVGAAVRHLGAGLACRDLLTCSGQIWPTGVDFTLQLHMAHRLLALVVLAMVSVTAGVTFRDAAGRPGVRALALAGPFLVVGQMTLGLLTIVTFRDFVPLTAHLAVAALLFADMVVLHLSTRGARAAETRSVHPVGIVVTA